ncbi:MAG: hypothetical protein ACREOU_06830 [Candidatus Eiseniibacteriota bacterium]
MTRGPAIRNAVPALFLLLVVAAGCGTDASDSASNAANTSGALEATARARSPFAPGGPGPKARPGAGHEWFPLVPGRTWDYRITKAGVGTRYLRATLGAPEIFFGRSAYPWVFSPVPGQVPDTSLIGLRQYFALGEDGALEFVGAQNNGFMSHNEPPLRLLLADAEPLATWTDTVFFESFLPGNVPFFEATQAHVWQASPRTHLKLPAGSFQALRSTEEILDVDRGARTVTRAIPGIVSESAGSLEAAFAERGVAARPAPPEILRGFWFARRHGIVARDYPHGAGSEGANTNTYELIDEGTGPIPPPIPVTP